jgi:hypothetical protein
MGCILIANDEWLTLRRSREIQIPAWRRKIWNCKCVYIFVNIIILSTVPLIFKCWKTMFEFFLNIYLKSVIFIKKLLFLPKKRAILPIFKWAASLLQMTSGSHCDGAAKSRFQREDVKFEPNVTIDFNVRVNGIF